MIQSGPSTPTSTSRGRRVRLALILIPAFGVFFLLLWQSCTSNLSAPPQPEHLLPRLIAEYPHDPNSFTQGLEIVDGILWESTGLYGESKLRAVNLANGREIKSIALDSNLFGEGITYLGNDHILQLTWKAGQALIWETKQLKHLSTWEYEGQAWGTCKLDETTLVISDGTSRLSFRSMKDFKLTKVIQVQSSGKPVDHLNELECVDGIVWANVWQTNNIVAIHPETGQVTAIVDAQALPIDRTGLSVDDVLNGIAHDPISKSFFLTGKRWPSLFEVEFVTKN